LPITAHELHQADSQRVADRLEFNNIDPTFTRFDLRDQGVRAVQLVGELAHGEPLGCSGIADHRGEASASLCMDGLAHGATVSVPFDVPKIGTVTR